MDDPKKKKKCVLYWVELGVFVAILISLYISTH